MANRRMIFTIFTIFGSFTIGFMLANIATVHNHDLEINTTIQRKKLKISQANNENRKPRKILLDCGANVASTVNLFRETYPDADDYIIHSFEIDAGLAPYFAYFNDKGHHLHCPVGVADKNGSMTAYNEGPWYPNKMNNNKDMQWGGGTLFVSSQEGVDKKDGGQRKLSRHDVIPIIDLSSWIQKNVNKDDYVIFKLDVEGAEYGILKKMLQDGTFAWIDKFYGEYHPGQPTGETKEEKLRITKDVAEKMSRITEWSAERKRYEDFDIINAPKIPNDTPGEVGKIINSCGEKHGKPVVSVVIEIGMNAKRARKLISTIGAYPIDVPLTLFVFGDFAEEYPELVKEWSEKYEIGIRCDGPMSPGHWENQYDNAIRFSVVSAERRLSDIGLQAHYILPPATSPTVSDVITKRKLRLIQPTIAFPPEDPAWPKLTFENYHKFREVEKVPKALKIIHDGLRKSGGILSLDSDFNDNYMISVFLLDYLDQTSGFSIQKLSECIQ